MSGPVNIPCLVVIRCDCFPCCKTSSLQGSGSMYQQQTDGLAGASEAEDVATPTSTGPKNPLLCHVCDDYYTGDVYQTRYYNTF